MYLPADLVALAKASALNRGSTLTGLMREGLEEKLAVKAKRKKNWKIKTYALGNYKFRRADAYE